MASSEAPGSMSSNCHGVLGSDAVDGSRRVLSPSARACLDALSHLASASAGADARIRFASHSATANTKRSSIHPKIGMISGTRSIGFSTYKIPTHKITMYQTLPIAPVASHQDGLYP